MLQRNVPDREGLKLCITGLDAAFVLVIELRQAGRHLAASRSGSGDDHQRFAGFDIVILPVAVIADDMGDVVRISFNGIVAIYLNTQILKLGLEKKLPVFQTSI